jgi:hypothetical protein
VNVIPQDALLLKSGTVFYVVAFLGFSFVFWLSMYYLFPSYVPYSDTVNLRSPLRLCDTVGASGNRIM